MNLHSPLTFDEKSFKETALGAEPELAVGAALLKLEDGKAFFVTGAGSSAGQPAGLPTGPGLAAILEEWARPAGFGPKLDTLADKGDLGQVCEMLDEEVGRPAVVREIQRRVDWRDSNYNLCHLAIALFYGEKILSVSFTANWDPKVGDAFEVVTSEKKPRVVWNKGMMSVVGNDPHLVHLHGHWSDPDSLVMGNSELHLPKVLKWTEPSLKSALSNHDPIFVGFGAEPEYVIHSLEEMRLEMEHPPTSVIGLDDVEDFSTKSGALSKALGLDLDKACYIQGDACEVMGELLRCFYRKHLCSVVDDAVARIHATGALSLIFQADAEAQLRAVIEDMPMETLLGLLWNSTARASENGNCPQRTIASCASELAETLAVVMTLCSCHDAADLRVSRDGFRITRNDGVVFDLCPAMPSNHINPFEAQTRAHRNSDRLSGPADAELPMVLVCAGTIGALPPKDAKVSLVGGGDSKSVSASKREPADVITFNELDHRFGQAGAEPATLDQGLKLWATS